jgi:enterochelin esterase-like enzyme
MKVWVWTPPEYDEPAYANSVFPVLTLYPGGNGAGYNTWANPELDMPAQVAALSKQRKSHPFILVMPAMQLVKEDETECMDIPGQPKVGTFQAEDVPAMVRANFRVPDTRDGWGVMGASSGGFCSMHLAFNKPDQFKAAAGIGAYFTGDSKLLEPHRAWRDSISPATLAGQGKVDTDLLLVVGADEEEENRKVDDFLPKVKPPVKVETYVNPDGKHLTKDFKRAIPKTLEFFTRELTGPTPG